MQFSFIVFIVHGAIVHGTSNFLEFCLAALTNSHFFGEVKVLRFEFQISVNP